MTRPLDPGFDPRLADWLESDPNQAPRQVLDTVLSAVPSIPQRRAPRVPWRLPTMLTPARIGVAAVLGVLLLGGAYAFLGRSPQPSIGGPAPIPTASPTASPTPAPSDYSYLPGSIMLEHHGNALDGSEKTQNGDPEKRRLYLIQADGSGLREFLPGQPASGKAEPAISPDGTMVAFTDFGAKPRVYAAGLDGTGFKLVSPACDCGYDQPAFSPDGTKLAALRVDASDGRLGILDLADGSVRLLESTRGKEMPEHPTWSPDGTRILFTRPTVDASDHLTQTRNEVVDVASGVVTELPLDPTLRLGDADWAPDGSVIVFTSGPLVWTADETTGHDIYTARPDGTGLTRLTNDGGSGASSWTPDGEHILFYRSSGMWLMDPDGGHAAPVSASMPDLTSSSTGFAYYGDWVPVGR